MIKQTFRRPPRLASVVVAVTGALGLVREAWPGALTIATEPLGTSSSSVKPNIMFILDDSGSMSWDYMPDYVPSSGSHGGCFDAGDDSSGTINGSPDGCDVGDPPYMSPDFNTIYYNPEIYYPPGVNYDGSSKNSQNATNTTNWTSVRTDEFNVQNRDQLGNSTNYVDLVSGYPDRVWCTSTADSAGGGSCRQNSAYTYPNFQFPYGQTSGGSVKYVYGGPYYYRIKTAQWCSDAARTSCRSGSSVNPTTDIYQAIEYCTDTELTTCAAGSGVTAAHVYSGVRWCSDSGTLVNCQRKRIGSFVFAKHLGTTASQTGTFPAVSNEGNIQVTSVAAAGGTITALTVGGVAVISGTITIPASSTTSAAATLIASAINTYTSSPDYTATTSGANVIVTRATAGATGSGLAIVVTAPSTPTTSAKGTITIASVSNNTSRTISTVSVNGTNLLCTSGSALNFGNSVTVSAGSANIVAAGGWNSAGERSSVMDAIASRVAACAVNGYTATQTASNKVEIVAPLASGSAANGYTMTVSGTSVSGFSTTNLAGGADTPVIGTAVSSMSGGADAFSGTRTVRVGVGYVNRTDIVPATTSYTKATARTDCTGASCTYAEEMTNFANWYTYYRSRMKMMKTAAGRAFTSIDDTYRVGFITINAGSPVSSSKYLKIADYTTTAGGQKDSWYTKFYGTTAGSSTPLREALSRVGWIFGGKLNTGLTDGIPTADDPMTASCQPSIAILSTDGYWNGNTGKDLSNNAIGNEDNSNSGYSKRADGAYDGNLLPTTTAGTSAGGSSTLADVAMYYYKTDLRTSGSYATNNVPTTNKDTNAAQHMVTYTLGLGLDGELTYRSDYESATSGDFYSIKQGTKDWPSARQDSPTALDDLWHAAVNGRGVFFSARNPSELSTSLTETLESIKTRVGAGAAAATSNLQPVAGDNFAFTAEYETVSWTGDLKARTIDLSSGIVSSVTLWSAREKLDATAYTDRKLYTFDPTDSGASGNLLKNFCWPSDGGANCADGSGLTVAEQAYFNPNLLYQYTSWTAGQVASATGKKLVDFLRGDSANYDSGAAGSADLFRSRDGALGDIINAQPAYVKKSPFSYTDTGYSAFKACTSGTGTGCPAAQFPSPSAARRGTVYVAANDGMLHAFETDVNNNPYYQTAGIATTITSDDTFTGTNTGNGVERWAYIPSIVMPSLYKLANTNYSGAHKYFVDGSPQVGDICISAPCAGLNDWRTIIVGGLNGGGAGFYALDITNPVAPKALWEFTNAGTCYTDVEIAVGDKTSDCHMGYSFGNPIITKRKVDGKWVVIVTSGYNNNVSGGDGKGYLYVLEAHTGKILHRISTGIGTSGSPSGLAKINGWTTSGATDNTTLAVYGGDLEGYVWRFQLDNTAGGYLTAVQVARVKDSLGNFQPITVKPELGEVSSKRVIMFGTGQFLEYNDRTTTSKQTIYALRDDVATTTGPVISNVRDATLVKVRGFGAYTASDTTRTVSSGTAPNWATEYGWLLDLPDTGERVSVDPQLQLGTLVVASNVPSSDTCTAGGYSWVNFLDYASGSYVTGATGNYASTKIASSLTVGINVIMLPGGQIKTIATTADNQQLTKETPVPSTTFSGRRVSWREMFKE